MLHGQAIRPTEPSFPIVDYLAGQFSVKLLQRECGLFGGDLGVWHPQDLGATGI